MTRGVCWTHAAGCCVCCSGTQGYCEANAFEVCAEEKSRQKRGGRGERTENNVIKRGLGGEKAPRGSTARERLADYDILVPVRDAPLPLDFNGSATCNVKGSNLIAGCGALNVSKRRRVGAGGNGVKGKKAFCVAVIASSLLVPGALLAVWGRRGNKDLRRPLVGLFFGLLVLLRNTRFCCCRFAAVQASKSVTCMLYG